ncbi:hypothetical protein CIK72_17780 [Brachybacterium alimentarium]|nr:hypothetical protein CIK72_17780 [Brachybacterium alimentarium]
MGLDAETVRMPGGSGGVAAELVADQLGLLGTHGGLMHDQVSHDLWRRAALQGRMCAMPV